MSIFNQSSTSILRNNQQPQNPNTLPPLLSPPSAPQQKSNFFGGLAPSLSDAKTQENALNAVSQSLNPSGTSGDSAFTLPPSLSPFSAPQQKSNFFGGVAPSLSDAQTQKNALNAAHLNLNYSGTSGDSTSVMASSLPPGGSLFGKAPPPPPQTTSIFGGIGAPQQQPQQNPSPFAGLNATTQQPQQQSQLGGSLFGKPSQQQSTGSIFGGLGVSQQQSQQNPSPFAGLNATTQQPQQQPQLGGSLFGKPSQQQSTGSIFGGLGVSQQQPQQNPSPFAGLNATTQQPQQQPQLGGSLFGKPSQQQSTGSVFGGLGVPQQQPQQNPSPFGGLNPAIQQSQQQPQQNPSPFGGLNPAIQQSQQQPQLGGSLFGKPSQQQSTGSIFGGLGVPQQQPQQNPSPFAGLNTSAQQPQQPNQQKSGLFGGLNASAQQPQQQLQLKSGLFGGLNANNQQQQPQQQQQGGSIFLGQNTQQQQLGQPQGHSQPSRLWPVTESHLHPRSVADQMELALAKWNPQSPYSLFQTYLYNTVSPEQVPFYRPSIQDDESKWEEALRKKPTPGSVPVVVKGFFQLGQRLLLQEQHLNILQGRLHEINDGLTTLLRKHDLEISIRAAECKRKHLRLSHQCLKLAAKVQVLKNRGYAMDSAEEELREKLLKLERNISDPALNGRAEEIWARMVSVRERARLLQREFERAGQVVGEEVAGAMDEEVMKRAKKVLEDYGSQLAHLVKELRQIHKDFAEWEGNLAT